MTYDSDIICGKNPDVAAQGVEPVDFRQAQGLHPVLVHVIRVQILVDDPNYRPERRLDSVAQAHPGRLRDSVARTRVCPASLR